MLSCEPFQLLMVDALYLDDPNEMPAKLQNHLATCEGCRNEFAELVQAREALDTAGVSRDAYTDIPERAELDGLYDRLDTELDRIDARRYRELPARGLSPWSVGIGALAASFIIFVTGFVFLSSNSTTPDNFVNDVASTETVVPDIGNTDLSNPELLNYLQRAQVMLMQVANAESLNGSVLPIQSNTARNMAMEASVFTGADRSPFNSGEKKLLRDIEFMLLQIANLDETNMAEGVALLQQFLEVNGILFRIRLLEMRDQDLVI